MVIDKKMIAIKYSTQEVDWKRVTWDLFKNNRMKLKCIENLKFIKYTNKKMYFSVNDNTLYL